MSACPEITAAAAVEMACCDDPHWRSMVNPGIDSGQPAASTAIRPILPDCWEGRVKGTASEVLAIPRLRLSFDRRRPAFVTATAAELATAMLDICAWADGLGFDLVYFAEHHGAEDGYLPSPVIASAAAAG